MISDIVIIILMVIVKALLIATATSLSVLELKHAKYFSDKDNADYDKLVKIMKHSKEDINSANILNAFLGVVIGFVLALRIFNVTWQTYSDIYTNVDVNLVKLISAAVIILIAAYVIALFTLVLPKFLADKYPDRIVLRFDGFVHAFSIILSPFIWLIDVAVKFLSIFINVENEDISEEEILMMVDTSGEQGSIDEHEMEMINNIFDFDDKNVSEIATHRKDIVAVPIDISYDELTEVIANEKFSRIPVYEEDIDHIVGILHIKDLMHVLIEGGKDPLNLKDIVREPYFVPETKKTDALFKELQNKKMHMAVVADEYGGTAGIVTMEDLIEEVMGEIQDEYDDEEEPEIEAVTENVIKIEGSADIEDVAKTLNIEMPVDEYDTLGGFLVAQLDRVPDDGEKDIQIIYKNCIFNIDKVENKRIVSATATIQSPDKTDEEN